METIKFKNISWINIITPKKKDMDFLRKKYRFHELDLEDCLSENQRPKIDEYEKYLFLILHFPVVNDKNKTLIIEELNIFIGANYIITIHSGELNAIQNIFTENKNSLKIRKSYFGKGTGYALYRIINELFGYCLPIMDQLNITIKRIEKDIFSVTPKDMLHDIMVVKRNIINYRRLILPQRSVVASLEHKNKKFLPENLDVYFDDIVDKIERLWSSLETAKEHIESLQDINESIISHNINYVMKILTIFSVTLLPLTFITGLYGMNLGAAGLGLPIAENPYSFFIITGAMVILLAGMLAFFKWKKWI